MKYKLMKPINENYNTLEQILTNRGIPYNELYHYTHTTDDDINSPLLLGEENLQRAAAALVSCIEAAQNAVVLVDEDCDGYTSAALLINYLHQLSPDWSTSHLDWIMHEGKKHGLPDLYEQILSANKYKLVICPDSASSDFTEHEILKKAEITVICLDHHLSPQISKNAIIINNQTSDYPNKQLSGVGITWQFCRYLDFILGKDYADDYLDLVALGNTADDMSLRSIETKHLISKGFQPDNIKNPFICAIWEKNKFKLGERITSWGAAFYIAPFINATVRSGTMPEKQLIFKSLLEHEAYQQISSTKRGHTFEEQETLVEQAMRLCTNIKSRQTKALTPGIDLLETKIKDEHLLNNKVLLFLLQPGQIEPSLAGLVANKMMGKYQRPCCVLTLRDGVYTGSARGCETVEVSNFKEICERTGVTDYTAGHNAAFGVSVKPQNIQSFIDRTNEILKDMPSEAVYYVDYIYQNKEINSQNILDIGEMDEYWGNEMPESLIAIEGLRVTKNMLTLMSPDKSPTLKITIPNGISIIKFKSSKEEYQSFISDGFIKINIVGKCNCNYWNNSVTPQVLIEDYEIVDKQKYYF